MHFLTPVRVTFWVIISCKGFGECLPCYEMFASGWLLQLANGDCEQTPVETQLRAITFETQLRAITLETQLIAITGADYKL